MKAKNFGYKPIRSVLPVVVQLFEEIEARGITYQQIMDKSGVHIVTLSNWRRGKSAPRWQDLICVAEALGMKVKLERKE